jgi:hypothetical protein
MKRKASLVIAEEHLPTRRIRRGPPIINFSANVLLKHVSTECCEVDEYVMKIGDLWLWMALVAPLNGEWGHPNIHFVFAKDSTEVGEYLCRAYPQYGDNPMIEVKLAKVHRPGIHLEM